MHLAVLAELVAQPAHEHVDRAVERLPLEATHLVEDADAIDERWLEGRESVGLTSGASAPERLVEGVCDWFRARGVDVREADGASEDVFFKLPVELRRAESAAAQASAA